MSNNERQFRRMWRWIAEETRRQKRRVEKFEYFNAFDISKDERPYCECYACKEGIQRARDDGYDVDHAGPIACCYCPIDWNNGKKCVEGGTFCTSTGDMLAHTRTRQSLRSEYLRWNGGIPMSELNRIAERELDKRNLSERNN